MKYISAKNIPLLKSGDLIKDMVLLSKQIEVFLRARKRNDFLWVSTYNPQSKSIENWSITKNENKRIVKI